MDEASLNKLVRDHQAGTLEQICPQLNPATVRGNDFKQTVLLVSIMAPNNLLLDFAGNFTKPLLGALRPFTIKLYFRF